MLKTILWHTYGMKRQQVEHIGTYNSIEFYALRGETDEYNMAFAEVSDGFLIPALYINRCQHAADQLAPDPLAYISNWFNNSLKSDHAVSLGVAQYLNRLQEAVEHNNRIEALEEQERQTRAAEEQRQKEENTKALQAIREKELQQAEQDFKQGKNIASQDFVDLCKRHGITIPLKTLGWCKKSLCQIRQDGYSYNPGKHNSSTVIYDYVDKSLAAIGSDVATQ